jgi:hypothetical protein
MQARSETLESDRPSSLAIALCFFPSITPPTIWRTGPDAVSDTVILALVRLPADQLFGSSAGQLTSKRAPSPGRLSTRIHPP